MYNEKVLVIDSDPELCEEVADFLWEEGFKVESASDEEQWRRRLGADEFDIVILDRKLAGPEGVETANQIKDLAPDARVFVAGRRPLSNTMLMAENIARLESSPRDDRPENSYEEVFHR